MALTAGSIEIKLFADIARLQSDMNKANKTVDTAMRGIDKSVALARRAFGGLIGGTLIGQVIKLSDEYKRFDAQLKLSTKTLGEYSSAYENVIRISRTAQSEINAVGVLYARLNNNLREFNVTQNQVAAVTESISLALRVNNATVQETNSVMLQLSQSFGSGRLNGQEFLAVAEGAPALLRQLAKSMNVPFGALKDLSAQSKITREELLKAFTDPAFLAANREMVKSVGTISSSVTVLMNNLKLFVGEQDKASGASKAISSVILTLANNINFLANVAIAGAIVATGRYIGAKYALIASYAAESAATKAKLAGDVVAARAQVVLMEAQIAATLATNAGTLALENNAMAATLNARNTAALATAKTGLATATTAAASSGSLLTKALALVGGKVGAITVAITAGLIVFDKLVKWSADAAKAAYGTETGYNGVAKSIRNINDAVKETPDFVLAKIFPAYAEYRKTMDAASESNIKFNQSLPSGVNLGTIDQPLRKMIGQIGDVSEVTKQTIKDMDEFRKENPLKDLTEVTQKYARDLALLNKAQLTGAISAEEYSRRIVQLKKDYEQATGATKQLTEARKDEEKRQKAIADAIQKARDDEEKYLKEIQDLRNKSYKEQFDNIEKENEAIQKQIDKSKEYLDKVNQTEEAYSQLELARMKDAVATAEQIIAQGKLNGLTGEALKYAEDYLDKLRQQVELKKEANELESNEEMWKRAKKIEESKVKAAKDLEKVNDRVAQSFSDALSNAIMRGFESGKSFAYNFRDSLVLAFKSLVLRPIIDFVIDASGIQSVLGSLGGILKGGTDAAAASRASGGGILDSLVAGGSNIFDAAINGFDAANSAFTDSIGRFGTWVGNLTTTDLGTQFGSWIALNKELIGKALPYTDAVIKLVSGDVKGAAFSAAGALIGSKFGPVGSAIGSFIGNAVGSLFGKKKPKMYGNTATGAFSGGVFSPTGEANFGRNMGAADALTDLNKAFSESFGALLKAFDENVEFTVSSLFRKRTNVRARFDIQIGGQSINPVGGKYNSGGFEAFARDVMGTGIIEGIKASNLPQAIKDVFNNIALEVSDSTKRGEGVNALINSIILLQNAAIGLENKFGLTVAQAVQLGDTVTDTNEQLVAFINTLSTVGQSGITVGDQILKVKNALTSAFSEMTGTSALPENLDTFDAALKAINKTTQDGINKFADLLSIRQDFITFTDAIAELQGGVNAAIFTLLSPSQQLAKLQAELGNMFGALNLNTPKSVQELIALGESIDLTTKEGLNLATIFPTLVDAFTKTKQAADGLVGTMKELNSNSFKTLVDFTRAQAYAAGGISLSRLPSYAVGTSYVPQTGPAMIHQGERILTASENSAFGTSQAELAAEIRGLRMDNQEMRRELQSIAISTKSTAKVMDRQDRDGIIIRDVNNEGDPQILKVEIV